MRSSYFQKSAFSLFVVSLLLSFAPVSAHAEDDTTLVPMDQTEAPATDLIYQGRPLDQDQAVSLRKKGVDLSTLEPVPNDMWGLPASYPEMPMPADGEAVNYDSSLAGFGHEISIHRVVRGAFAYRLDLSTVPHRALLTRALLNRLGYVQYAPRRYRELKIRFQSMTDRQSFLDAVALDTVKDPSIWVKESPSNRPELTLQDVILEPGRIQIQNYYWAALPSDFSEGRRAQRALLLPISLCDAPENIDSYRWDFDRILNNSLLVSYPHEIEDQRPFDSSTIDDIRWIARKIAPLTREDWTAIVSQAQYPPEIAALVLEKIIARRNQMLASLGISAPNLPYDPHFTDSAVKNGEVIQSHFDGYASRFTYGDAEDPLSMGEMTDLGFMHLITAAMQTLSSEIAKKGTITGPDSYLQDHLNKMAQDFFQHMVQHPNEPYSQPISTWGGPVGGLAVSATREISTGTFYGSDAAIQLVDTFGFSANVGYFRGIDGIKNAIPSLEPNVTISRNFTHLRSMPSISEAMKAPATDTLIPVLLNDLSVILAKPSSEQQTDVYDPVKVSAKSADLFSYTQAVEDLLSKIRDGEFFTITDTLTAGVAGTVQIPVQVFFPGAPVGYNQGLSFGPQGQGMTLRRTTLRRVHDDISGDNYLQIYVQSLDSVTGSLTLDFNYWLNIASFGMDKNKGLAKTRVYTLKSDPSRPENSAKTIANAVRSVLNFNSDSKLMASYPFYLLRHDLTEDDWNFHLLFFQSQSFDEAHTLKIQPPIEADHPFDPKDFERTFYSYRKLTLSGINYLSFLSGIIDAASKGVVSYNASSSDNPAYSPYGHAHWIEHYSDAELTPGRDYHPVTMAKETWAGWSISQSKLFEIFDTMDQKLGDLAALGVQVSPIHRDVFAATDQLEFYNITATTIFYQNGMDRIISALEPAADPSYHPGGFFSRWSEDSFSSSDQGAYNQLISWIGGAQAYQDICDQANHRNEASLPQTYLFKGNSYSCLESWMTSMLKLRRAIPSKEDHEGMIRWQTQLLSLLEEKVPAYELMRVAGKDGFYFQTHVDGFRKGDHEAKDSEQSEVIASYISDSVGTADPAAGSGAYEWLAEKTKIIPYEISALFFTGGM